MRRAMGRQWSAAMAVLVKNTHRSAAAAPPGSLNAAVHSATAVVTAACCISCSNNSPAAVPCWAIRQCATSTPTERGVGLGGANDGESATLRLTRSCGHSVALPRGADIGRLHAAAVSADDPQLHPILTAKCENDPNYQLVADFVKHFLHRRTAAAIGARKHYFCGEDSSSIIPDDREIHSSPKVPAAAAAVAPVTQTSKRRLIQEDSAATDAALQTARDNITAWLQPFGFACENWTIARNVYVADVVSQDHDKFVVLIEADKDRGLVTTELDGRPVHTANDVWRILGVRLPPAMVVAAMQTAREEIEQWLEPYGSHRCGSTLAA